MDKIKRFLELIPDDNLDEVKTILRGLNRTEINKICKVHDEIPALIPKSVSLSSITEVIQCINYHFTNVNESRDKEQISRRMTIYVVLTLKFELTRIYIGKLFGKNHATICNAFVNLQNCNLYNKGLYVTMKYILDLEFPELVNQFEDCVRNGMPRKKPAEKKNPKPKKRKCTRV